MPHRDGQIFGSGFSSPVLGGKSSWFTATESEGGQWFTSIHQYSGTEPVLSVQIGDILANMDSAIERIDEWDFNVNGQLGLTVGDGITEYVVLLDEDSTRVLARGDGGHGSFRRASALS
ncbi:MAG: hypothetical protein P8Y94_18295 [Acidobacteriota bacterium]